MAPKNHFFVFWGRCPAMRQQYGGKEAAKIPKWSYGNSCENHHPNRELDPAPPPFWAGCAMNRWIDAEQYDDAIQASAELADIALALHDMISAGELATSPPDILGALPMVRAQLNRLAAIVSRMA